jgi:hypothetical protein
MDALTSMGNEIIIPLLEKYRKRSSILFEGVIISDTYGAVGEWLEQHIAETIVAFLSTPLEECLASLDLRGSEMRETTIRNTSARYAAIERVKQRMIEKRFRVETIDRATATERITSWLS